MSTPTSTDFERCVLASGLLEDDQLDVARQTLRTRFNGSGNAWTERQLADYLVESGDLNAWQALQLLEGRTKFNLGPYQIVDSIGRGGMGQVFKARHGVLGRIVAVKVLPRHKSTPEAIASFTHEIRVIARLDHENLVRAFDAGEDGNVYYLVTEYVPGTDLRKLVRAEGPLSMAAAAAIIWQVAAGLQHAHDEGMIHRDVKPGNVLVTPEGFSKLSDLGLAGSLKADGDDPRFGRIVGTADYLSPDHIQSPWDPTPAWDIYSLGCTLYYAVTGKVPFPGGSTADKARAHCELRPLDPRRLNASLSPEFVETMADMMAKEPSERIQTSEEVMARLTPWADEPLLVSPDNDGPFEMGPFVGTILGEGQTSLAMSDEQDMTGWEETQTSFPEIPELTLNGNGRTRQPMPTGSAVLPIDDESSAAMDEPQPVAPRLSPLGPLLFLLVLPSTLVGTVLLLAWLLSMANP